LYIGSLFQRYYDVTQTSSHIKHGRQLDKIKAVQQFRIRFDGRRKYKDQIMTKCTLQGRGHMNIQLYTEVALMAREIYYEKNTQDMGVYPVITCEAT
jgi:hypothetical protein